ncbi:LamG-like jellyroll fold domain-containing protein [Actinomadura sp. NEAU-AAG7]|uniref:LamG-like jellyroll fold domain-containing protein n=1 Tax=Actinomadura sp. NEAU-AAG7 TaxID=2839640 RepID=UPI0027E193B1|nr:LamG-like jellyroll fold domain-containing protein [Actinomadura sp. NEAU-AAG7]
MPRVRRTATAAATALSAALLGLSAVPAPGAAADIDPPSGTPPTVSADPLPTWQVNGVVWSMVTVGGTVYATGDFSKARPPGTAEGDTREVARSNILAFDLATGDLITSFDHALNGQGLRVAASPDGRRVYVGGEFTQVDGKPRARLAAFDTATGALDEGFAPQVSSIVRGIAATNSKVYFGGNFFNVNGKSRTRLAAVNASNGANDDTWRPTADDNEVFALAMAPSGDRVVIGGRFQKINGAARVGIGAVNTTDGASVAWSSRPIPTKQDSTHFSYVTDLYVAGDTVYGAADGEGGHWFDGRFAAKAATGDLVWLDNCYGATYGMFVQGQSVYSVSHAHDCASLGAFPETRPQSWQRALAETTFPTGTDKAPPGANSNYSGQPIPSLLHWFPTLTPGTFTGQSQAAWAVTGNDDFVAMGGEFPRVNGKAQQGLVRFALKAKAPNKTGPLNGEMGTPTAKALPDGSVRLGWKTTWDMDNASLKYEVLRDDGTTPVGSVEKASTFWNQPSAAFVDRTAPAGAHTYKIRAVDSTGNRVTSAASAPATAAGTPGPYSGEIGGDGPSAYWRLGESSGPGYDYVGGNDLTFGSGVTRSQTGAISGDPDRAVKFGGTSTGTAASGAAAAPQNFSIEAWVKTTSKTGGKIVGYGSAASGLSTRYDRHLYMTNDGRAVLGVYPGSAKTIQSAAGLNDGKWHHVAGTLDADAGLKLYVDGQQKAADASVKTAEAYAGYWRVGGDNTTGWPAKPSSDFLNGTLDEVAVYPRALTAAEITRHHGLGTGGIQPNKPPTAAFTSSCDQLACAFDGSGSADTDGTVAGYAWDFGDGKTGEGAKPSHTYATAGTYTVKLRATDDQGASAEVSHPVTVTSATLAADAFGRTVTGGWGDADSGGAWTRNGSGGVLSVGGTGQIALGAPGNSGGGYLNGVSSAGTDLTFTVALDKEGTGNGVYVSPIGRRVGSADYRARVRLRPSGAVSLKLSRTAAGNAETDVAAEQTVAGVAYEAGRPLHVRLQVTGTSPTTLKAKVWADGAAEPDWQLTGTDSTAELQTAGALGVWAYLAGNSTNAPVVASVDDLVAVRATG